MVKTQLFSRISLLVLVLMCNACGEFAYKRGAAHGELENARKSCKTDAKSPVEYDACMSDKGWVVKNFDERDPVAEIDVMTDNRYPVTRPLEVRKEEAKPGPDGNPLNEPVKVASPDDLFKISSWWKIGGSDAALKVAMNQCVISLGDAHTPNVATQEVSRAFLLCMKKSGWTALRAR